MSAMSSVEAKGAEPLCAHFDQSLDANSLYTILGKAAPFGTVLLGKVLFSCGLSVGNTG